MQTERDLKLRLNLLKNQLKLITLYEDDFVKEIGKQQTLQMVDDILDEMIVIKQKLKSRKND
jgi:hypothetical protein